MNKITNVINEDEAREELKTFSGTYDYEKELDKVIYGEVIANAKHKDTILKLKRSVLHKLNLIFNKQYRNRILHWQRLIANTPDNNREDKWFKPKLTKMHQVYAKILGVSIDDYKILIYRKRELVENKLHDILESSKRFLEQRKLEETIEERWFHYGFGCKRDAEDFICGSDSKEHLNKMKDRINEYEAFKKVPVINE